MRFFDTFGFIYRYIRKQAIPGERQAIARIYVDSGLYESVESLAKYYNITEGQCIEIAIALLATQGGDIDAIGKLQPHLSRIARDILIRTF